MRLKIELQRTWAQQNNPDGPATFCRQGSSNAFQVSWAEHRGEKLPDVTVDKLQGMAMNFGQKQRFGEMLESSSGACKFGMFGAATFRSTTYPRIQIWFISNGRDHIMATYICSEEPQPSEVTEAQQIAQSLALGP